MTVRPVAPRTASANAASECPTTITSANAMTSSRSVDIRREMCGISRSMYALLAPTRRASDTLRSKMRMS